jgi:hypothetical protein
VYPETVDDAISSPRSRDSSNRLQVDLYPEFTHAATGGNEYILNLLYTGARSKCIRVLCRKNPVWLIWLKDAPHWAYNVSERLTAC